MHDQDQSRDDRKSEYEDAPPALIETSMRDLAEPCAKRQAGKQQRRGLDLPPRQPAGCRRPG
jgi:hypothetical protein